MRERDIVIGNKSDAGVCDKAPEHTETISADEMLKNWADGMKENDTNDKKGFNIIHITLEPKIKWFKPPLWKIFMWAYKVKNAVEYVNCYPTSCSTSASNNELDVKFAVKDLSTIGDKNYQTEINEKARKIIDEINAMGTTMNNTLKSIYSNMDNEHIHYVMWSGGCDSTLLLYEACEAFGADRVVAVSYNYPWLHETKHENEKLYREIIKSKLKLRGYNIRHTEFDITQETLSGDYVRCASGGLPQSIAWLLSVPMLCVDGSIIYTGDLKSDDSIAYLHNYEEIVTNVSKVLNRKIEYRHPYQYMTKYEVIDKLIRNELYDDIWFCEIPNDINKRCCKCHPCTTHMQALYVLSMNSDDELVKAKAKFELEKFNEILNSTDTTDTIVNKA